jgi:lipopolysaccharide biosynthesis regulator YciM
MHHVLLISILLPPAASPPPAVDVRHEIEELSRKADESAQTAEFLNQRLLLEPALSPQQKTDLERRTRRALERAAEQYTRVRRLLDSLNLPTAAEQMQASRATLKAAKARLSLGDYKPALDIYERVADQSSDPQTRVAALGGAMTCHAALGQPDDLRRTLSLLQEEIPCLNRQVRGDWERWAEEVENVLKTIRRAP